jgi:hypothetical protein
MEIRVELGHASTNPERRCSDGDSLYVTSSVENVLVRLLGIDAFEVKGMSLYYLEENKFLQRLPVPLQEHLKPLLMQKSIRSLMPSCSSFGKNGGYNLTFFCPYFCEN